MLSKECARDGLGPHAKAALGVHSVVMRMQACTAANPRVRCCVFLTVEGTVGPGITLTICVPGHREVL